MKDFCTLGHELPFEQVDDSTALLTLADGKQITIERSVKVGSVRWPWRINGQYFYYDDYARGYLNRLIVEMVTGKRVVMYPKQPVPEICGVDGAACRNPGECNSALCSRCPVAEKFFAERDGVELVYAFAESAE